MRGCNLNYIINILSLRSIINTSLAEVLSPASNSGVIQHCEHVKCNFRTNFVSLSNGNGLSQKAEPVASENFLGCIYTYLLAKKVDIGNVSSLYRLTGIQFTGSACSAIY